MGTKITLKGFEKYKGGLDTVHRTTGEHSIYTTYKQYEIMFHVSTMLPFSADNPQQLERKRHIGNDIVILVYKEGNKPFVPNSISSEFVHVIGIIQPKEFNGKTMYKFSVTCKDGVSQFLPRLPPQGLFPQNEAFRSLILAKLINGEKAVYKCPAFVKRFENIRSQLIGEFDKK